MRLTTGFAGLIVGGDRRRGGPEAVPAGKGWTGGTTGGCMKRRLKRILAWTLPSAVALLAAGYAMRHGEAGWLPPGDVETDSDPLIRAYLLSDSAAEADQFRRPFEAVVTVDRGDTLMRLLTGAGLAAEEADRAVRALAKVYPPRRLRPGQKIVLTLTPGTGARPRLLAMRLAASAERDVAVRRENDDRFRAKSIDRPLVRELARTDGRIATTLYAAALDAGTPLPVLAELIHIFSFDVDFQRDVRPGDTFAVMYERYLDENGTLAKTGDVLVAEMTLSGRTTRLYRFEPEKREADYFDAAGRSIRRALLRTPIDGARLTSGFGRRRHPVLGYTRMHRGIDFAAPRGTPVYAAGRGFVEFAGRNGGFGNYIRIRHNGMFKTAYAHLSRFARGLRTGRRVRQGEIIGYVGSTGISTGPHLHYEVLKNGRQVNPRRLKLPSGRRLAGAELERFEAIRAELDRAYATLAPEARFAEAEPSDACGGGGARC